MKRDDPALALINKVHHADFIQFVETGQATKDFLYLVNTRPAYQYALSIRARCEESILVVFALYRRILRFAQRGDRSVEADVLRYFATDHMSPALRRYLAANQSRAHLLNNFRMRAALLQNLWTGEVEPLPVDSADQATMLTRRFERIRRLWPTEPEIRDDPPALLIASQWRHDYQTFIATGIADEEFLEYINGDFGCQQALRIQAHYEENLLFLLAFDRRLASFAAKKIDPMWRSEFLAFFATGDVSQQLRDYLDDHKEVGDQVHKFLDDEQRFIDQRKEEVEALTRDASDQASILSCRIEYIRRLWLEEEFRP